MTRSRDTFDMFEKPDRGRFGDNEQREDRAPSRGRVSGASDLVEVTLALHYDTGVGKEDKTGKAVNVSADGDEAKAVWLPHSQIEIAHTGRYVTGKRKSDGREIEFAAVTVTLPEWLAKKNGLI